MKNSNVPLTIESRISKGGHVQGIAVDTENRLVYLSFTTELVKMDFDGNTIGSVQGWIGHLGCIDFDSKSGCVYASLEIKNDKIGQIVKNILNTDVEIPDGFYVAVFDVDKITKEHMNAQDNDILSTCFIAECTKDYKQQNYGCSGIDGLCIAPDIEDNDGVNDYLYLAYGIYKNMQEGLNDEQIILKFKLKDILNKNCAFSKKHHHTTGADYLNKYFLYTGNTNYGIQNLEYDAHTKNWFLAVYKGAKPWFPNYSHFIIDGSKPSKDSRLSLKQIDKADAHTPGFNFKYGQEGMYSLDNGYFYLAESVTLPDKQWSAILRLYEYDANSESHFVLVEK